MRKVLLKVEKNSKRKARKGMICMQTGAYLEEEE